MESKAKIRKIPREVDPRPFLPGEEAMIARTHKKMLAARAKIAALQGPNIPARDVSPGTKDADTK